MTAKILFSSDLDRIGEWNATLGALRPGFELVEAGGEEDPDVFEFALIWKPPAGGLKRYPNLKAIQSLGAGVNQLDLAALPDVPLARLVDANLTSSMVDYAQAAVLRHFRSFDVHERDSREGAWRFLQPTSKAEWPVGVLGLGEIGAAVARGVAGLGFPVRGWARSKRAIDGVETFAGSEALEAFLAGSRILINVLPLTPDTTGFLSAATLGALPRGAHLVNIGRGGHLVEADLVRLLDEGHVAGATLDVLSQEPPPAGHPLMGHPKVLVTPHVAGISSPQTALKVVLENYDRALAGRPLLHQVDRARGY